jgi:hypothetical protein
VGAPTPRPAFPPTPPSPFADESPQVSAYHRRDSIPASRPPSWRKRRRASRRRDAPVRVAVEGIDTGDGRAERVTKNAGPTRTAWRRFRGSVRTGRHGTAAPVGLPAEASTDHARPARRADRAPRQGRSGFGVCRGLAGARLMRRATRRARTCRGMPRAGGSRWRRSGYWLGAGASDAWALLPLGTAPGGDGGRRRVRDGPETHGSRGLGGDRPTSGSGRQSAEDPIPPAPPAPPADSAPTPVASPYTKIRYPSP